MKLLIAIVSKEDRDETERVLTDEGFMLTEMGSTGGFLRKKSVTLLIGTPAEKVGRAKELIKHTAGKRPLKTYQSHQSPAGNAMSNSYSVPVETQIGGCTVFEIDASSMSKY